MVGAFAGKVADGDAAQFLIDGGEQFVERGAVAGSDALEQADRISHGWSEWQGRRPDGAAAAKFRHSRVVMGIRVRRYGFEGGLERAANCARNLALGRSNTGSPAASRSARARMSSASRGRAWLGRPCSR